MRIKKNYLTLLAITLAVIILCFMLPSALFQFYDTEWTEKRVEKSANVSGLNIDSMSLNEKIQLIYSLDAIESALNGETGTSLEAAVLSRGYKLTKEEAWSNIITEVMKLAEALQERADLNRNIEQLKNRLSSNALVQEGEQPVECPENLKQELDASISRLSYLIARINRTNCQTVVEGQTLTELIAQKDALSLKLHVYRDVVYAGSQISYRARNTEIKIRSAFSVADWQKEIDRMSKELRRLDNRLQESNWKTDLVE